jgi:hypothetical protein
MILICINLPRTKVTVRAVRLSVKKTVEPLGIIAAVDAERDPRERPR